MYYLYPFLIVLKLPLSLCLIHHLNHSRNQYLVTTRTIKHAQSTRVLCVMDHTSPLASLLRHNQKLAVTLLSVSRMREMGGASVTLVSGLLLCLVLHEARAQSQGSFLFRFPFLRPFSLDTLSLNSFNRERDRRPDKPIIVRASRVHKVSTQFGN